MTGRVATDAELAEFVRRWFVCPCGMSATFLEYEYGQPITVACETHGARLGNPIRIRPKPRKVATPEEVVKFLRADNVVAISPATTTGAINRRYYSDATEALSDEDNGRELLWLVDPEETQ